MAHTFPLSIIASLVSFAFRISTRFCFKTSTCWGIIPTNADFYTTQSISIGHRLSAALLFLCFLFCLQLGTPLRMAYIFLSHDLLLPIATLTAASPALSTPPWPKEVAVSSLAPFSGWGNRGSERWSHLPQDTQQSQGVDPGTWLTYLTVHLLQAGTSWPPQPVLPAPSSEPVLGKEEEDLSAHLPWGNLLPHPLTTSLTLFPLCLPLCTPVSPLFVVNSLHPSDSTSVSYSLSPCLRFLFCFFKKK